MSGRRGKPALVLFMALLLASATAAPVMAEDDDGLLSLPENAAADDESPHKLSIRQGGKHLHRKGFKLPTIRVDGSMHKGSARQKASFSGIPDYFRSGHNITRLSHMLYRVIQQYHIGSMVDVPCRGHSRWMGRFLENVRQKNGDPFVYYCVDSSPKILELAESRMPVLPDVSTNYIHRKFWKLPMPKADLVFSWEGLEKMKTKNVESMLNLLRQGGRHKYFVVGSSPSVTKNSNKYVLNLRRSPFSFNQPQRIYKEIAVDPADDRPEKHMYLYMTSEMQRAR